MALTRLQLAGVYSVYGWSDLALRSAADSFEAIAGNIRYWQQSGLGGLASTQELLEFDNNVRTYRRACAAFSQTSSGVAPLGAEGLEDLAISASLPLEPGARLEVVSQHMEKFEKHLYSIMGNPAHNLRDASGGARHELRRRISAEKDLILAQVKALQNDVFRRRSELREVLWNVLRIVDWETHALLSLSKLGVEAVEGQVAESFTDPTVEPAARDRIIRAMMSRFTENNNPEKVAHWSQYLSESEAS